MQPVGRPLAISFYINLKIAENLWRMQEVLYRASLALKSRHWGFHKWAVVATEHARNGGRGLGLGCTDDGGRNMGKKDDPLLVTQMQTVKI